MNFGFNPPDPDQIFQSLERMKDAFNAAASAETGSAKPAFEKLSTYFSQAIDSAQDLTSSNVSPQEIMSQLLPMLMGTQQAFAELSQEVQTNPAAAQALRELQQALRSEFSSIISGALGPIAQDLLPKPKPKPPETTPKNDNPAPPQKKPKPKGGNFKL